MLRVKASSGVSKTKCSMAETGLVSRWKNLSASWTGTYAGITRNVSNIRSRSCAEQNEGLAYTTRVNCAETTITLCADSISALNVRYVKYAQETIL